MNALRFAAVVGIGLTAATGLAATGRALAADERPGRFTMSPTDGGFLRLDTETGAVSFCTKKDGAFACEPTPDGQAALKTENDKLRAENKILKDELKSMEETFGLAKPGEAKPGEGPKVGEGGPRPGGNGGKLQLPSEKDVDQAFDYVEKMMKKLRERLKRLEDENKPGQQL